MRTPRSIRLMLGLGLLAGGVAVGAPTEPTISVKLPQQSYNVKLTGRAITAPHLQLSHSRKEIRGRIFDAATVITFNGNQASGNIGGEAVSLKAQVEGDTLKAKGGFGGSPAELTYSPAELTVYLRSCTYRLKGTEEPGTYVGRRSCDRVFERETVVQIPEALKELSPAEQATVLLLSL
ncbi:MAG: hypothetical protein JXB05_20130 [Myxococcaceae bacterium]|nr:hypothetical protein [Myxococcaceae bacterium]